MKRGKQFELQSNIKAKAGSRDALFRVVGFFS
jgi:hypothetical protein